MSKKACFITFLLSLLISCPLWAHQYDKVIIQINGQPLLTVKKYHINALISGAGFCIVDHVEFGVEITSVPYQQPKSTNGFLWQFLEGIYSAGSYFVSFFRGYRGFSSNLLQDLMTFALALGSDTLIAANHYETNHMSFIWGEMAMGNELTVPTGTQLGGWGTIFEASQSSPSPLSVLLSSQMLSVLTNFIQRGTTTGSSEINRLRIPQSSKIYLYEPNVIMTTSVINNQLIINLEGTVATDDINLHHQEEKNRSDGSGGDGFSRGSKAGTAQIITSIIKKKKIALMVPAEMVFPEAQKRERLR